MWRMNQKHIQQYTQLMDIFIQITIQQLKMMATSSTNSITGKITITTMTLSHIPTETCPEKAVVTTV